MYMLGLVLTRLQQQATSAICTVKELTLKKLSELLGVLTNLKTQFVGLCSNLLSQLVPQLLRVKALLVQSIIQVLLIKPVLTNVVRSLGELGKQLVTTVQQTLQRVMQVFKKDK
jgi:hypothetical protein